jgi:putative endonuclease
MGKITKLFSTRQRGANAEQLAADFLVKQGYEILQRNFNCKLGEIDIVARHRGELVFVEVRSRHSETALNPVFSVNRRKQEKIIRAAQVYIERYYKQEPASRFDVVIVTLNDPPSMDLIANAFTLDSRNFL